MYEMIPTGFKTQKRLFIGAVLAAFYLSATPVYAQESARNEAQKTAELLKEYTLETGQPQSMAELLAVARAHSPDWQAAKMRVTRGDAAIAGAAPFQPYNPEVDGSLGLSLNEAEVSKFEIMLSQRVDIFGQRARLIEAARLKKKALQAAENRVALQATQRVRRDFELGLIGRERLRVEHEILAFTQELFDIAKRRYEAGEEPRASLVIAQAELARARQELVAVWVDYRNALHTLAENIGWQGDTPPQPTGELEAREPLPDNARLLEQAFAQDLELVALNMELDAARAELAAAERSAWPDPRFGIGYERETRGAMSAENTLHFAIGVPIPLWNLNQGEVAEAHAKINIARQAVENRKRNLRNQLLKHADRVRGAHKQVELFEEEVLPALTAQLEMLQAGFELGDISMLDVMNARDRLLAVQRQSLDVREEYLLADSQLRELLGLTPNANTGETP